MSTADPAPIDLALPQWRDDPQTLLSELQKRLSGPVVIDASLPRPIDTLTVQILMAARRFADGAGTGFQIINASDAFRDGLRVLGLHDDILG